MEDMKEWIQNKAEELSITQHDREFHTLPTHIRDNLYAKATELYKDHYADLIDSIYEREKYRRLGC